MTTDPRTLGRNLIRFLSSYGLACVLILFLFLLTLLGTLEQIDRGLFEVQKEYFESWYLVHRFGPVPVLLPGGVLCMSLLALNLFFGGLFRIRKTKRTAGVIVIHLGIVLMLAAGLVKLTLSEEGHLTLFEGQRSDEFQSYYLWEVAVWDARQLVRVQEYLVSDEELRDLAGDRSRTFESGDLPFELTLSGFVPNCRVLPKGPQWTATGPTVDGYGILAQAPDPMAERNVAGLHLEVRDRDGDTSQAILWGLENYPFTFEAGGSTWCATLRHKRYKMPYTIILDDFTKEDHPGISMAKSYMSDVTKVEDGREQKVRIQMNEPLRQGGLVLFQASWGPSDARPGQPLFSTFAVVRNPSDQWPLISCIIIAVGMLMAFSSKLTRYVRSQAQTRATRKGAGEPARRAAAAGDGTADGAGAADAGGGTPGEDAGAPSVGGPNGRGPDDGGPDDETREDGQAAGKPDAATIDPSAETTSEEPAASRGEG